MCRIEAVDIKGRIGFGIAQPLGIREYVVEGDAFAFHAGQDVIARAIQDARNAGDVLAGHSVAQRTDGRNTASNGSFEQQRHRRFSAKAAS